MSETVDTLCGATHAAGNVCCMPAGHIGPHNDGGCSWAFDDRQQSTKATDGDIFGEHFDGSPIRADEILQGLRDKPWLAEVVIAELKVSKWTREHQ